MSPVPPDFKPAPGRWFVALAGTGLHLCLGTLYAWSFFQKPLVEAYGWSHAQVAWAFSLAILFLSTGAAIGGMLLPRVRPRVLAVSGGLLFALGHLLAAAAVALRSLPLLWAGYGVVAGLGAGLGYVVPVATVARWFPDLKGLATGMVIMGFGLGALVSSKLLAPALVALGGGSLPFVFLGLGAFFLAVAVPLGWRMANPPGDPEGRRSWAALPAEMREANRDVWSWRFALMWAVFFGNIVAGIMFIGFQSPMLQELMRRSGSTLGAAQLAAAGATLIAFSSVCNGLGRFAWGAASDRLGRANVFRAMLLLQAAIFFGLRFVESPALFSFLVCAVLLCYGGGFGVMPSFVMESFGPRRMAEVYGAMLTAWGAAGVVGPQAVAWFKDHRPADAAASAFLAGALALSAGFVASLLLREPASCPVEPAPAPRP
jgi:OFA family oxalate/formate antiporter-like MFS transporter